MTTSTITSPEPAARGSRAFMLATLAVVAWGALAFGSPYPWAYIPLGVCSAALGAGLIWTERGTRRSAGARPVAMTVAVFAAGAALQLVPLPPSLRETISPASTALLDAV